MQCVETTKEFHNYTVALNKLTIKNKDDLRIYYQNLLINYICKSVHARGSN